MLTQIYNGKVLIPGGRWVNNGSVLIKDSEIVEVYGHSRIVEGEVLMPEAATFFRAVLIFMFTAEVAATLWRPRKKHL